MCLTCRWFSFIPFDNGRGTYLPKGFVVLCKPCGSASPVAKALHAKKPKRIINNNEKNDETK